MEEVPTVLPERASTLEDSQHTQGFFTASKHTTSNKHLTRKKSAFKLATEFFKPNKAEKLETRTPEHEKQERMRGQWNPFVSLRGSRDSKKRAADFTTARCSSSSPQKYKESGMKEFGTQKGMRRKSLQDLLGAVGGRFSIAHRRMHGEDMNPQRNDSSDALKESQDISPLILPGPALPIPEPPNAFLGPLYHYSKELVPEKALGSHKNLQIKRSGRISSHRPKWQVDHCAGVPITTAQLSNAVDEPCTPELRCKSQESKGLSLSASPERLRPTVPSDFLWDLSPQVQAHVRFVDTKDPPQHGHSNDVNHVMTPETANLDPSFPSRTVSREAAYKSCYGSPHSERADLTTQEIEKHVAFTAAKMSKNLHLSTSRSRWSVDSSETDTDKMSEYNSVGKEMEVQDIVDRGKEIMTLGTLSPYLHSSNASHFRTFPKSTDSVVEKTANMGASENMHLEEARVLVRSGAPSPQEGSLVSVRRYSNSMRDWNSSASFDLIAMSSNELEPTLARTDASLQGFDECRTQAINCKANHEKKKTMISLQNGGRFRPEQANSRLVSSEPIHVFYPPSDFCAAYMKTYISKSSAFGDIYENHSGFSDYCLFDQSTRTFYPQALSDPIPDLLQSNDERLQVIWLPLEMFPADSMTGQRGRANGYLSKFDDPATELARPSSSGDVGVPSTSSGSLLVLDTKDSETAASNTAKNVASSSNVNDGTHYEYGAWVGYTNSFSHANVVGLSQSPYSRTLISTREVHNSMMESLKSEDLDSNPRDMDDSYEVGGDSATARLYLRSLFSSTESLKTIGEAEVTRSNSVNSIWSKLEDGQSEEAKQVKTWIQMEREFLDKYSPDSQMSPGRRGQIAVYEAFKKLKGWADSPEDDSAVDFDDYDSGFQDAPDTEQREAYIESNFEHLEDTVKYEPTREELTKAQRSSNLEEGSFQSLCLDSSITIDAKGKGKEIDESNQHAQVSVPQLEIFGDYLRDTPMEQQAVDLESNSTEHVSTSQNPEDEKESCWDPDMANLGSDRRSENEESSDTDYTAITMLSGCKFTKYAVQLTGIPREAYSGEPYHCEKEFDSSSILSAFSDHPMDIASRFPVPKKAYKLPPTELLVTDAETGSDIDQLSVWPKNENMGLATGMAVKLCLPPTRVNLAVPQPEHSTSSKSGRSTHVKRLSSSFPSRPRLATPKRVLTPNKRTPNVLTELVSQMNTAARATSPIASEADTEASENFGQKLHRFRRVEEDEKENEDHWWTDSVSYG